MDAAQTQLVLNLLIAMTGAGQPPPPPSQPPTPVINLLSPPSTPPDDTRARAEVNATLVPSSGSSLVGVGGGHTLLPNFAPRAAPRRQRAGVSSTPLSGIKNPVAPSDSPVVEKKLKP